MSDHFLFGSNWFTASNWSGVVPTSADEADIDQLPNAIIDGANGLNAVAFQVVISASDTLTVTNGATLTVGTIIDINGDLISGKQNGLIVNGGTVNAQTIVIGSNVTTGGVGSGYINVLSGVVNANISLNTASALAQFVPSTGNTITYAGSISPVSGNAAGGEILVAGGGRLLLTGDNTAGTTVISAGALQVGNGGATGSLDGSSIQNSTKLTFDVSGARTIGAAISGSGLLGFTGSGGYNLTGANSFTGLMSIDTLAAVAVKSAGALGAGQVNNNGFLAFYTNATASQQIFGTGRVTLLGATTVTYGAAMTYSGQTTVGLGSQAVLKASIVGAFSAASDVNLLSPSFLELAGFNQTIGGLTGAGVVDNSAASAATLTIAQQAASETYNGGFQQNGGALGVTLNAAASVDRFIFTGHGINTGATTVTRGVLQVGDGSGSGAGALGSRAISISSAGTLDFNLGTSASLSNAVSGVGHFTVEGATNLVFLGDATNLLGNTTIATGSTLQIGQNGGVGQLGPGDILDNGSLIFSRATGAPFIANFISGSGAVTFTGGVEFLVGVSNSYAGVTTIAAGTTVSLAISSNDKGTLGQGDVADNGAQLFQRGDTFSMANKISGTGSVEVGSGAVTFTNLTSYTGGTTIDSSTSLTLAAGSSSSLAGAPAIVDTGSLTYSEASGSVTVANLISGAGNVTFTGGANFILNKTNTYTGTTTIGAGSVTLGFAGGNNGTLGTAAVTDNGLLGFNRSDTITVANLISGTGSLAVVSGGVNLTNANTYGGGTGINGGVVSAGHATSGVLDALGSGVVTFAGSGALEAKVSGVLSNAITVNDGVSAALEAAAGTALTVTSLFSSSGATIDALHFGSATDTGAITLSSTSISGPFAVFVDGGTLSIHNFVASVELFTGAGATTIASGATLDFAGHSSANSAVKNLSGGGVLTNSVSGNTQSVFDTQTANSQFDGVIQDGSASSAIGFALQGTAGAVLTLTHANTYSGGTTISGGTLGVGNASALGTGAISLAGGALESKIASFASTKGFGIAGAGGTLEAAAGDALSLTGAFSDTGGAHTLHIGSASDTGTVTLGSIGGTGLSNQTTVEIDGGALNVLSSLSLANVAVTFTGTAGKLILNGQGAHASSAGGASGEVDLNNARVNFSGGGEKVVFDSSATDFADLYNTGGSYDTVLGSNGKIGLNHAVAAIGGGGNTITFDGSSADYANLFNTGAAYDTVLGSNGMIGLNSAVAAIGGGGNTITFDGSSADYANLFNTGGSYDTVVGSNGKIGLNNAVAAVAGNNDEIDFNGGSNSAVLNGAGFAFVFSAQFGLDTISNFASTDTLQFSTTDFADWNALNTPSHLSYSDGAAVITLDANDFVTLTNVAAKSLTASQFKFVLPGEVGAIATESAPVRPWSG